VHPAHSIDPDVRPEYPDLARVGAALRRWWPAILVTAVLFAALGAHASKPSQTPYSASAQVLVGPLAGELSVLRAAGQQAQTYADIAVSRPVYVGVIQRLKLKDRPASLGRRVSVDANSDTRLLRITVRAGTAGEAAREANALADELIRQTPATTAPSTTQPGTQVNPAQAAAAVRLKIVERAIPPSRTNRGSKKTFTLVAGVVGALLAATIALIAEAVRRRIETVADLEAISPVPVIGRVRGGRTTATTAALARARERVVVVDAGQGADVLALALARAVAGGGRPVLLIDDDPHGTLTAALGLPAGPTSDAAGHPLDASGAIRVVAHGEAARPVPPAGDGEAVIICAGHSIEVADATDDARAAVLAVAQNRARAADVVDAVRVLERHGWSVGGAILVSRPRATPAALLRRRRARSGAAPRAQLRPADRQPA